MIFFGDRPGAAGSLLALASYLSVASSSAPQGNGNFSIVNGQIYTPGLAIIDSPQPFTPEGGDYLQVAIDVSGNGQLPWPPVNGSNIPTQFYNVTLFLTSYDLGHNFTISNATSANGSLPFLNILQQEPGSTVKHVNWVYPLCLVGDTTSQTGSSARGVYNISIHQRYRLNNSDYYTIFDLPINVSNSVSLNTSASHQGGGADPQAGPVTSAGGRVPCDVLENPLLDYEAMLKSTRVPATQPYLGGPVLVGNYAGYNNGGQKSDGSGRVGATVSVGAPILLLGLIFSIYF